MKNTPHNHYVLAFWATLTVALTLIIAGFCVPPVGVINGSVLTAVGEMWLWPSLALGYRALCEGKKIAVHKGDVELNIGEDNGDNQA